MAQRIKLVLEYFGGGFSGWQRQEAGVTTVQSVLEEAVFRTSGETAVIHASGRTDAGVHALGQVAHFVTERDDLTPAVWRDALNAQVRPHPVSVLLATRADDDFHARFSAKQRHYEYRILNRRAPATWQRGMVWHVIKPLDLSAMQQAAAHLLGQHDFSTFRAAFCQAKSPIRTLQELEIAAGDEMITLRFMAPSFLYHQVRNMVGTLTLVGHGRWQPDDVLTALQAKDRGRGGPTAPPEGLVFLKASY
jgi:tRNA pseudouridine38-40 synthase